jgi:hypothetical protein
VVGPNGRLHVVDVVLEPIPVAAFSLIPQQRSISGSAFDGQGHHGRRYVPDRRRDGHW